MIEVELKNISKTIHKTPILHDINLKFHSGAIYGLKGKNGCGKTMLMRTICGLMIPSTGTVSINGKVLMKDIEFPESIGALIENPAFLPQYTGYKNLCMLASLRSDIDKEAVAEAMRRVQLDPEDKRVYRKYSLGMKQKLGIANAIMGEPDIIVLDEPINALDEASVEQVKKVLVDLRERDHLIIIACHDREELEYLSDEIIEIKDGTVVRKQKYYMAKSFVVFVMAAITVMIPLLLDLMAVMTIYPLRMPERLEFLSAGILDVNLFSGLYETNGALYALAFILLDGLFAGLLALVSVCVAERVESMFSAIVIPFAFYIMWSTVMMENNDGRFSVMEMLNPRQSVVFSRLQVVLMAVGGTLIIILWLFLKGRRKDVL